MASKQTEKDSLRVAGVWTTEDARENFDALIKAAINLGPQKILHHGRELSLSLRGAQKLPDVREILRRGGPLDNSGELD
ncbi:hypothetical protein [Mycoplana dimorpha]|uniref:hypothetical protein n=1 Tax=Mycoplana dimorpha TaxID=28320 RepID=UPI001475EEB4|nr:hypothetical protein [Mycoplana dimorpha]